MLRLVLLFPLCAGCISECPEGASRCVGNTAQSCQWRGDGPFSQRRWETSTCAVTCVVIDRDATCVASATPIPECARDGAICRDGGISHCRGGYLLASSKCDDGLRCVDSTCGPLCAHEARPDARCDVGGVAPASAQFCDGNTLVSCECGYVTERDACRFCKTVHDDVACVDTAAPDPRCGDPALATGGFCEGNTAFACWYGFVAGSAICGTGTCVLDERFGASCQYAISSG